MREHVGGQGQIRAVELSPKLRRRSRDIPAPYVVERIEKLSVDSAGFE